MAKLDEDVCEAAIVDIFQDVAALTPMQIAHALDVTPGKLFELYGLGRLLKLLTETYYCYVEYTGGALELQQSGGFADPGKPHFRVYSVQDELLGRLYTDVEVGTLGASQASGVDRSHYHEIDLVLLRPDHALKPDRPTPWDLLFGVECKGTAEFSKTFVREVLGRRRELSVWTQYHVPSTFDPVRAQPPSLYWLVYLDPNGDNYATSPAVFGVNLEQWLPTA